MRPSDERAARDHATLSIILARSQEYYIVRLEGSLHSERLVLRSFHSMDLDGLHAIFSRPDVMRYLYGMLGLDPRRQSSWPSG